MHLYSLTLQQPTAINKAIIGNFSGNPKVQEILVSKGKILQLMRIDENGKLSVVLSQEVFGLIRSISPFRLPGVKNDFIIVLSDSGRIVLLEYDPEKNAFNKLHQETYGKSGCRRIVPGQYIAVDPSGRACMIGDLYKLTFHYTKEEVHSITLEYFDTIPVANSMCILKKGYLFAPSDVGNHSLYKFISKGDEKNAIKTSTTMGEEEQKNIYFCPRELKNLQLVDELQNLSVIGDLKIDDLTGEGTPQIYALCAAGTRSSLRILRHGLAVNLQDQSPLSQKPTGLWTVNMSHDSPLSRYIVLSFLTQTLILSISDKVVEVQDSGLELKRQTLLVQLMEDDNKWFLLNYVLPNGFKHIKKENKKQTVQTWQTEGKIVKATANSRQLAIALQTNELIYFELDSIGELNQISKTQLENEVLCMDIGAIPEGRQRCKFLAIGLSNQTVRMLSLDPDTTLLKLAIQALQALPEQVSLIEMKENDGNFADNSNKRESLFLYVGMHKGLLLRANVDPLSGTLQDITRFLGGTKPVKLSRFSVKQNPALLALSSKPWICYNYFNKFYTTPISTDQLDFSSIFSTSDFMEGIVGISGGMLKIMMPENYGELLNQKVVSTKYTPRKMLINQQWRNLVIIEADHRIYPSEQKEVIKKKLYDQYGEVGQEAMKVSEAQVGTILAPQGCWASCIRILDPITLKTMDLIELEPNYYPSCFQIMNFTGFEEQFLVMAVVKDFVPYPGRKFSESKINIYFLLENGRKIELMHSTVVEDMVYSLSPWKGKLICSVGHNLRVYELGKKKLLKKAELKEINSPAINIQVFGDRIFCAFMSDSIHVFKYKTKEQTFQELCDDVLPRWISSFQVLDYHTVVATDKFENCFISRIPLQADQDLEENPQLYKLRWEQGFLNGAPFKMEQICNFFVGELITFIQKTSLVSTENESLIYGTTMGSIGAFYPFETKEDIDFFVHLEMHLRLEAQPLCGREHVTFRSYYGPCKGVIDGDLCEQFGTLNYSKQKVLAEELERTPQDVNQKLEEIRNKIL